MISQLLTSVDRPYDAETTGVRGQTVGRRKKEFGIGTLVMIGDRGMISSVQIDAMRKIEGVDWITALKSGAIASPRTGWCSLISSTSAI